MSYLLGYISEILFPTELFIILFPVVWLVVTPVVLVSALFKGGGYSASVRSMYAAVTRFWTRCAAAW
jgi:hypothetical protein